VILRAKHVRYGFVCFDTRDRNECGDLRAAGLFLLASSPLMMMFGSEQPYPGDDQRILGAASVMTVISIFHSLKSLLGDHFQMFYR
jgi:hypothetical protein